MFRSSRERKWAADNVDPNGNRIMECDAMKVSARVCVCECECIGMTIYRRFRPIGDPRTMLESERISIRFRELMIDW